MLQLTYLLEVFTHTRTHEVATDNKGDGVPSPALGTIKQDSLQAVEEGVTICPCVPRLAGKDGTSLKARQLVTARAGGEARRRPSRVPLTGDLVDPGRCSGDNGRALGSRA